MISLVNDALPVAEGSGSKGLDSLSASSILQGVDAVEVSSLPLIWQQIAARNVAVGHSDPDFLVAMAQLFYTKATDRSPEVFQQKGFQQSPDFQSFYANGARKTLDFFGHDFVQSAYPDFDLALETARAQDGAERVVAFVRAVFNELGYDLPASFYWMLLCPIERDSIHEARPMFFDPQMQGVKRAYDACLHGFNVTAMLMLVQSRASEQGLLIQHGCGCDHSLAQLIPGKAKLSFEFESAQGRKKALTAYLWRCWNEYLLFPLGVHAHSLAL
ncbi:hypothetical protein [cf. Phormidesmis sp. LEGE 11477]|uniref:hypothetical protein n=1 Tax=cf. Phormidesmis sp. LEGE 11477 TaxID=1828680 RepID=UPI0018803D54|nr:hypothetical protein [cf. Phormidesmis sp. LEGE 11477]MBE9064163.1 hypothetical protein [cf. Phormidesmis sp. LEGE 11477]